MRFSILYICQLVLLLAVVACGSGDGNGDEVVIVTSNFPPVVFTADKDTEGTVELYASSDDGTVIIKLSGTMTFGGDVVDFAVSPDGIYVAYVAGQDTNNVFELYAVPVDKTPTENAVKISGAMAGSGIKEVSVGSGEYFFAWAPNSSRVAYIADQNTLGDFELFTSTLDGTQNDTISDLPDPFITPNRDVVDFEWEPNSTQIAYVADQDSDEVFDLYVSPFDSNTPNAKLSNAALNTNGIKLIIVGEYAFAWAPNSSRVAYLADQLADFDLEFELYTNLPNGTPNSNILISGPQGNSREVEVFAWAPDSSKIAYLANQLPNPINTINLFTALPNFTGSFQQISDGINLSGQAVTAFDWAPNSSRIAFIADKIPTLFQLFTTSPNDSNNVLVSGDPIGANDNDVTDFKWAPDSSLIAYSADDLLNNVIELFTTLPAAPIITRISGSLVSGGDVFEFDWAPNSSRVAYTATQNDPTVLELFSSTPDGTENDLISGTSMAGDGIADSGEAFAWAPDSSGVGYIADQNTNDVFELFASLPAGGDNTRLSGSLVSDGDVFAFEWVP